MILSILEQLRLVPLKSHRELAMIGSLIMRIKTRSSFDGMSDVCR